ncbi:ARS-binding protein 2 [Colletotrichum chlorophyti]|uniref:ARS-binding protein 2 n=1 Tax=Colletotrichum chlorophyti TaxID=708187 RepID=A0A1Q8RYL2_9PEZI|nr:ARS-binding protein 2 [Colletotrichum chlorophyti]
MSLQAEIQRQPHNGLHGQSPLPPTGQPSHGAAPSSSGSSVSASPAFLPDRNVTAETIEDAYVQFVLYCNPAIPPETDAAALREAFRVPPKSGGKSFSTFTLFQLIRRLETKEIKTWAELALKLGVEPPDQGKGQSSQKIQQYAVRLKRWMHSMHVDAFFEYLMDHPHPYWIDIPHGQTPVREAGRDGVLAEDDMALRALLPHIRPKRGRKRPEDDEFTKSPSRRLRVDSPPGGNGFSTTRADHMGPWSAHPDGRAMFSCPDPLRLASNTTSTSEWPEPLEQAPAYLQGPMSAVTPSTGNGGFWGDSESRSSITPPRPKASHRRHGAKVVSSAWRSGGSGSSGKTRGRPPMTKTNMNGPYVAFPTNRSTYERPSSEFNNITQPGTPTTPVTSIPQGALSGTHTELPCPPQLPRPVKPNISPQVPERSGGSVRLATSPPPVVMVNDDRSRDILTETNPSTDLAPDGVNPSPGDLPNPEAQTVLETPPATTPDVTPQQVDSIPIGMFENMEDRTNIDAVLGYFAHETANANWVDAQNNPIECCSIAEANALVHTTVERMWQSAANRDAFLVNIAALAGGKSLMTTSKLRIKREEEHSDRATYTCSWEFRLGSIRGHYNMVQTVMYDRWRKPQEDVKPTGKREDDEESVWEKKYRDLLALSEKRDKELQALRAGITATMNRTFNDAKDLEKNQRE